MRDRRFSVDNDLLDCDETATLLGDSPGTRGGSGRDAIKSVAGSRTQFWQRLGGLLDSGVPELLGLSRGSPRVNPTVVGLVARF